MRVMMSAAGSAVAPGIIRHLQRLGHYVIGHDCCQYGFGPTVCDEFHHSPPVSRSSDYIAFLLAIKRDFCLPFLDEELRLHGFSPFLDAILSPDIDVFTSKVNQQHEMQRAKLPVAPIAISGDVVAKLDHGRGGKGIIVKPPEVLIEELAYEGYLTQRFIDGEEYTVDTLTGMEGAFLFAVPRLRIQANGVSVIGKIVMDEEIIDLARQVVSKFAFRGPINIQIIRERDTGKLYIIELNPRLSGSCMFTVMAGFDILDATIKLWEGKPFVKPKIEDGLIVRRHYVEDRL